MTKRTNNKNSKNNTDKFIMQPKVDYCFKEIMKDMDVLKGILSAILNINPNDIKSIELKPTELRKLSKDDKYGLLDVKLIMNSNEHIDMEIQVLYFAYWQERSMFYLSKMFTEQLKSGDEYNKLNKCIHIGILNFNLFKDYKEYYSRFHLAEDTRHNIYSDKLEIHILELPKLKYASEISKEYSETTLYDWGKFFSIENEKELKEMYGKNEYIDKACDHIVELSADEMKKIEYDERFKALCDYNTQMNYNYNKGVEDGVQQGIQQGIDMTIMDLIQTKLAKNMSISEIAKELEKSENIITEYINQIEMMNS